MAHSEPFLFAVVSSQDDFLQIPVGWKGRFNTCHGSWEAEAVGLKALCLPSHLWPCSKQGHAFPCPQAHPSPLQKFHRPGLLGGEACPHLWSLFCTQLSCVLFWPLAARIPPSRWPTRPASFWGPAIRGPVLAHLRCIFSKRPVCNKADVGVFLCLSLRLLQVGLKSW